MNWLGIVVELCHFCALQELKPRDVVDAAVSSSERSKNIGRQEQKQVKGDRWHCKEYGV